MCTALPILQPLHDHADIHGQVFYLAKGGFADVAAFEIDAGAKAHLGMVALGLRSGQISLQGVFVAVHNLERNELFTRLQQDGLFRLDVVILRRIRLDDIYIHRLVQYIDKSLRITVNAVYVDGGDASRDMIVQDGEMNIPYQEWFLDLGDTAQLRTFSATARPVKIGASDLFIDL